MQRRSFVYAAAAAGLGRPMAGPVKKGIIELSFIRMRNSAENQRRRTGEFLAKSAAPALKRAGCGPVGLFTNLIGQDSPMIVALAGYGSLAELESVQEKLAGDKKFQEEREAYLRHPGRGYERVEKWLLRGFESMPRVEVPPVEGKREPRVFELRIYESDNSATLARKMKMFDEGEIAIFRRLGMLPVFFGETLYGPRMPNLTYMVGFDSLAAREQAWAAFGRDAEWQKLRSRPGLSDAEIVSNISNSILRPLAGSDIR